MNSSSVQHEPDRHRFVKRLEGHEAELVYRMQDRTMNLLHTETPPEFAGRGIGAELVQASVDHARANGLKILPSCSYAAFWFNKHPEAADLLA